MSSNVIKLELDRIVDLRKTYEASIADSRIKLYKVIAETIRFVKAHSREKLAGLVGENFKVTKKTSASLIAMKLIFPFNEEFYSDNRDHQRKCSAYAAAVDHAIAKDITPEQFVDYAKTFKGGIEAMRTGSDRAPKTSTPDAKAVAKARLTRAKEILSQNPAGIDLDEAFFPGKMPIGSELALLVRPLTNGHYQVIFATAASQSTVPLMIAFAEQVDAEVKAENSLVMSDALPSEHDDLEEAIGEYNEAA
jgi:hypothetical protein